MEWVVVQQTCNEQWQWSGQPMGWWVVLKGYAYNKPKTVGEALGVKGRNLIELAHYKKKR